MTADTTNNGLMPEQQDTEALLEQPTAPTAEPAQEPQPLQEEPPNEEMPPEEPPKEEEAPPPVNATVTIIIAPDRLSASMIMTPPQNGGEDVSVELVRGTLRKKEITHGILEEEIEEAVLGRRYASSIVIAQGEAAVDGIDGIMEEYFSREIKIQLVENEQGAVDFKNLNLIQSVEEGTVIAHLTPAVPPQDGKNIAGDVLHGIPGLTPPFARGRNTEITPDGLDLIASKKGQLLFEKGAFCVNEVLRIHGDVNNAVGNVDFGGDVVIDGNVCEGYAVRCDGNVTINGGVEGAIIRCKGDIALGKGMNGMGRGMLAAGGDVRSKFLENCTIRAGGSVYAESIVQSRVVAEDKIVVVGKRGVIVGGSCTATNSIEAKVIGASSNIATNITMGASPEQLRRRRDLAQEIADLRNEIIMLGKDIEYLENRSKMYDLVERQKETLMQKKMQRATGTRKIDMLEKELEGLNLSAESLNNCRLHCEQIFPPTKIVVGNAVENIRVQMPRSTFYFKDGQICRLSS